MELNSTTSTLFGNLARPASAVLFAGMGGACEGIRQATGTNPLVAINHCAHALRLHALNHPDVLHLQEDVLDVVPRVAARGQKLDILWLSPDCTHHSRARGGKPRENGRRSLADVAIPWAEQLRPRIIMLENVSEWLTWGPLDDDGMPVKELAGSLFREWVGKLEALGYRVEWRVLVACDYGAPTSRKRVYLIARCDGKTIVWPEPTHGPGKLPYWTAAECIDWSIPCPSIFERKKPLAPATERRIAEGLRRFVMGARRPFIVNFSHGGRVESIDSPAGTIRSTPKGGDRALVTASLIHHRGESIGRGLDEPCPTVTATGQGHIGLVTAWLAKHFTGATGSSLNDPMGTITAVDHQSLCTAILAPAEEVGAMRVAAFLLKYYATSSGLVALTIDGENYVITDIQMRMLQPRELARAMGFLDSYILEGTKEQQVARIGNAVCPDVAAALVRANV